MNESIGMAGIPVAAFSELRDGAIFMAVIQEETVVRCIKFTLTELVSSRFGNKWVQPIPGVQSITTLFRGIARKMGAKGRLIEPIFAR